MTSTFLLHRCGGSSERVRNAPKCRRESPHERGCSDREAKRSHVRVWPFVALYLSAEITVRSGRIACLLALVDLASVALVITRVCNGRQRQQWTTGSENHGAIVATVVKLQRPEKGGRGRGSQCGGVVRKESEGQRGQDKRGRKHKEWVKLT